MAVVPPTITQVTSPPGTLVHVVSWILTNGDTGTPFQMPVQADRSVQVFGTFGAAGSVKLQGSNEVTAANWADLHDPQGVAIAITAAKVETISEITNWIRPNVTAGDGTTSLTVAMLVRKG